MSLYVSYHPTSKFSTRQNLIKCKINHHSIHFAIVYIVVYIDCMQMKHLFRNIEISIESVFHASNTHIVAFYFIIIQRHYVCVCV